MALLGWFFEGVRKLCSTILFYILAIGTRNNMEIEQINGSVKYEIELKRGGQFQLWKSKEAKGLKHDTLVVVFGPFGFTRKLIAKYCEIYFQRGLAVLYIPNHVSHFTRLDVILKLANDLVEYLDSEADKYTSLVIHAFSAGTVSFNICCYGLASNYPKKFDRLQKKIKAIIYDSYSIGPPEDRVSAMSKGITRNRIMQFLVHALLSTFFFIHHKTIEKFNEWQKMCRTDPVAVPTLYFLCENDPMSDFKYIKDMIEDIKKVRSFPILVQCWKKSKHSAHFMLYPEEYLSYISHLFDLVPELNRLKHKHIRSKI